jgi:putative transposase
MSKPPRDRFVSDSRTYFVSANTWGSRALFQADDIARLFLATLYDYRKQQKYQLHEFVLMLTHFHILLSPETTLERSLQLIKGGFSFRVRSIVGNKEIWERGYVDHRVRDVSDYSKHRDYIHQNPCKAGLAARPESYPYSSAYPKFELDPVPQRLKPTI